MPNLVLYIRPTCPYCVRVLRFMEEHGLNVPTRDIGADPLARQELVAVGGKSQVPCLFIDGRPLYESMDIIEYLRSLLP